MYSHPAPWDLNVLLCIYTQNHRNVCHGNICALMYSYPKSWKHLCCMCVHTQNCGSRCVFAYSYPSSWKYTVCCCIFKSRIIETRVPLCIHDQVWPQSETMDIFRTSILLGLARTLGLKQNVCYEFHVRKKKIWTKITASILKKKEDQNTKGFFELNHSKQLKSV